MSDLPPENPELPPYPETSPQPPPQAAGYPAPYGAPAGRPPTMYPESSQAVTALILSIAGAYLCAGLPCPVGWYIANKELQAIDQGRRDPSKRDMAMAAKIIGIFGTVLLVLAIAALIFFALIAIVALGSS